MADLLLYNIYNDVTGKITKNLWLPAGDSTTVPLNTGAGETAVQDGNNPNLYYYPPLGAIGIVTLEDGGSGYDEGSQVLTIVQAGGLEGTINVTVESGIVVSIDSVETPGSGYSIEDELATTGGGGAGCTVNITKLNGTATLRPVFTDENSWNQTTIDCDGYDDAIFGDSLPNPTEVVIRDPNGVITEETVTTGTFTFTTLTPGDHVIKFTAFPYLDYEVTITAEIIDEIANVASWDVIEIDADGSDTATLGAGLPNPTTISITIITAEGAEEMDDFDVTTGSLTLKSNVVGEYSVTASAPGYTSLTQIITVVAT